MATPFSELPHPLAHAGTSSRERDLPALAPAYAPLDDRTEADILAYLFDLSRTVVHHAYEDGLLRKSDWQDFFRLALPFQLTLIGREDPEQWQADFAAALDNFTSGLDQGNLYPIFARVFDLALLLNRWYQQLPEYAPLRQDIRNLIENDLGYALNQLVGTANEAQKVLHAAGDSFQRPDYLEPLLANPVWNLSLDDLLAGGIPIPNALPNAKGTLTEKKKYYLDRVADLFLTFRQGLSRIVLQARALAKAEPDANHPAHLGLLYAFLQVFGQVRQDLNRLTERHLDFYYRQVLGLVARSAQPDHVHLVLELDKLKTKHLIAPETRYKASEKDKNGAEIHFALPEETLLNQARVASLRTMYRSGAASGVFASAFANSFDGKGAPFQDPAKAYWNTLGSAQAPDGLTPHEPARIGFLVASPVLLLQEGTPEVQLTIRYSGSIESNEIEQLGDVFSVQYSSTKGWESGQSLDCKILDLSKPEFQFSFQLQGGKPLVFADAKALGSDYGTTDPLVKFELQPGIPDYLKILDVLGGLKIVDITVAVIGVQVKNLLLSNAEGPLDPAKPFLPFGAAPKIGAELIVGSEEVFRKNLKALSAHVLWDQIDFDSFVDRYQYYNNPPKDSDFQVTVSALRGHAWSPEFITEALFPDTLTHNGENANDLNCYSANELPVIGGPLLPYSAQSADGFVKIKFANGNFRHEDYAKELAEGILSKITTTTTVITPLPGGGSTYTTTTSSEIPAPKPPYTPIIKEFYLVYDADGNWRSKQVAFAHLHPFEASNREYFDYDPTVDNPINSLLPPFTDEGALYIGLQNYTPGSNLQLLFQLAEATADPDVTPNPERPHWAFLAGNIWTPLAYDEQILDDATNGLIASGIVKLALPFEFSSDNATILPRQFHWLRVSVQTGTAGLSDTIGVHAQAIKTDALILPENDRQRPGQPLAPEEVTKPVVSDAGIKKIAQPYASFGGRPVESPPAFRQRISERLRHKGRAITLYDYERMVLNEFPQVYKVKCLTHTLAHTQPQEDLYYAPGYVVLAIIPEIAGSQFAEKLEPKATRALLHSIEQFLLSRTSTFVQVRAVNPIFQKVDIGGNIAFRPGKEVNYYEAKLREDVLRFLAPWAFGDVQGPSFGGKLFQSSVLHFIEKLDYVDYVTDFWFTDPASIPAQNLTEIEARTERSILAPGDIDFNGEGALCPPNPKSGASTGLGYQILGPPGGLGIGPN